MIDHPDPTSPVTADGTIDPNTVELYDNDTAAAPVAPGNVNSRSVNKPFPDATSTDKFAAPEIENGNRVAFFRAPAAGVGVGVVALAGAAVTAAKPANAKVTPTSAATPRLRRDRQPDPDREKLTRELPNAT